MKKVISVILSFTLSIASFYCIYAPNVSAENSSKAKYRYEINFDNDETKNVWLSSETGEIASAVGYDGKTSNMLHIPEDRNKITVLNYGNILTNKDSDSVFSMSVKPNTYYKLSWRMKINPFTESLGVTDGVWYALYLAYNGKYKCSETGMTWSKGEYFNLTSTAQKANGSWLYFESLVTTSATQDKLSLYFNLGDDTPETWIDDIVLEEAPYENPLNWGQTSGNQVSINDSVINFGSGCSIVTGAEYIADSDSSLKLAPSWGNFIGLKLDDLKANTKYILSFKHKAFETDKAGTYTYYKFLANGVYTQGTDVVYSHNTWGKITATKLAQGNSDTSYNFGVWNDYSITFETGDDTTAYFITRLLANVIYINDFSLKEAPLDKGDGYFETLSNWVLDKNSSTLIGTTDASGDISKAIENKKQIVTEKSDYAVEFAANNTARASIKLNLKANREYKLSFSFYSDSSGSNNSSILNMGIYAPNAENAALNWRSNPNGIYGYVAYMAYNIMQYESADTTYTNRKTIGKNTTVTNYPTGQWNDISFNFTSENYTNLYFTATIANGCTVYFDNIELIETKTYHDYDVPSNETVITFDDNRPYNKSLSSNMKIEIPPVSVDGSENSSNALHIIGGEYSSNTVLNWANTWGQDEDLVFSLPVKENSYYKWSAWVYMPTDQKCEYFAFYSDKNSTNTYKNYAETLNSQKGQWIKLTQSFKTLEGQTKASTTLNLGGANKEFPIPDIYIDNISLTLVQSDSVATINFETNGGSKVASIKAKVNTDFVLPVTTRAGYSFGGWYTDQNLLFAFSKNQIPLYDTTLYAKWTPYTESGWGYMQPQSFETWNDYSKTQYPVTANMENVLFVGDAPADSTGHTGSKILRFNNTATSSKTAAILLNPGDSSYYDRLPLNNYYILKDGGALDVTFKYKVLNGSAKVNFFVTSVNWNVYAQSGSDEKSATFALDSQNSDWQSVTLRLAFVPKANADVVYGLAFNVAGNAQTDILFDDFSIKPTEKTTITFDTRNGLEIEPITNYAGAKVTLPYPSVKTGKYFAGWYIDDYSLNQSVQQKLDRQPDSNITLYAKWTSSESEALKGWFDQNVQDFETWNNSASGATSALSNEKNATISVGTPISGEAYSGSNVLNYKRKWSLVNNDNGVLLNVNEDRRSLEHSAALPGAVEGKLVITFKYKLIKGSASVYFKTITSDSDALGNIALRSSDVKSASVTLSSGSNWQSASVTYEISAGLQKGLGLWIKSDNTSTQLMIDDVSVSHYQDASEINGVVTAYNSKAAIRAEIEDTKQGIRLYHTIDKDWLANNNIVEYGILAVRTTKLVENGYSEPNLESIEKVFKKGRGVAWNKTDKPTPVLWYDSEEEYVFTSVLTGIEEKYYDDDFSVRTYAVDNSGTVIYGAIVEVSVYDVVDSIKSNPYASETDLAVAKKIMYEAELAKENGVSDVRTYNEVFSKNVSVHNADNAVINNNFHGVNIIHQLFNYMPDIFGRTYNEQQIALEKETFQKMRVKKIRSFYGSSLSYDPKTGQHVFDKSNEYLEGFIQSCLDMQEIGVEVGITPQWDISAMFKKRSSSQGVNLYTAGYAVYNEDGTVDLEKSAENFEKFIEDSVLYFKARGVNNIKQMFCFTEVNNVITNLGMSPAGATTAYEKRDYETIKPVFARMLKAVHNGLVTAGVRDNYQIIAPCDNWRFDDTAYSELVKYCVDELSEYIDVIGSHNSYARSESFLDDAFYSQPLGSNGSSIELAKNAKKEFWFDEYNVDATETSGEEAKFAIDRATKTNPQLGVALGSMINGVMNSGASNVYLWALYDQQWINHTNSATSDDFYNGVHVVGYLPTYLESYTPRAAWYATSLLTRYIGSGKIYSCESAAQSVYVSAIDRDDGELTVLVTNYNYKDIPINVSFDENLGGRTLYRYVYNPSEIVPTSSHELIKSDREIANVTSSYLDAVSGNSVVIYTTEKPE